MKTLKTLYTLLFLLVVVGLAQSAGALNVLDLVGFDPVRILSTILGITF